MEVLSGAHNSEGSHHNNMAGREGPEESPFWRGSDQRMPGHDSGHPARARHTWPAGKERGRQQQQECPSVWKLTSATRGAWGTEKFWEPFCRRDVGNNKEIGIKVEGANQTHTKHVQIHDRQRRSRKRQWTYLFVPIDNAANVFKLFQNRSRDCTFPVVSNWKVTSMSSAACVPHLPSSRLKSGSERSVLVGRVGWRSDEGVKPAVTGMVSRTWNIKPRPCWWDAVLSCNATKRIHNPCYLSWVAFHPIWSWSNRLHPSPSSDNNALSG